jgi:long-chain acyl-CoA synthetase
MEAEKMSRPWEKYYSETARNFDADAMAHGTLVELINHAGTEFANRPAMTTVLPNGAATTLHYAEWLEHSRDFATYLRETAGLQRGETVAMMTPNCIDFTIAAAGAFLAGAICTNINPLYTAPEMEHQLNDSKAKLLIIIDMFGDKVDEVVGNTDVRQVVKISLLDFFPFMKKLIIGIVLKHVKKAIPNMAHAHIDFADALSQGARARNGGDIASYTAGQSGADSALFQYTSGTTGRSKGAELSHTGILANAAQANCLAEEITNPDGDTTLVILPLYHITAFALIFVLGIAGGDHMVLVPSPRPPSNLKTALENFTVTRFTGINTLFAVLLEADWFRRDLLTAVAFCGSGGAAPQTGAAQRLADATGVEIYQGYGMT